MPESDIPQEKVEKYSQKLNDLHAEVQKVVFGQPEVVANVIRCMACNGHVLLEGVPGTGKTTAVITLSRLIEGNKAQRIQFTPDLLPSDIVGTQVYQEGSGFEVKKGPIFGNMIVADEINRTPPKVQSAMLQAMAEREVTIGKETFKLPKPYMVAATQNPLEQKGVYPLPEAQVDRFLFKLNVGYAPRDDEKKIIDSNLDTKSLDDYDLQQIMTNAEVRELHNLVPDIKSTTDIKKYIVRIIDATRYPDKYDIDVGRYTKWGGSPRATIYLNVAAKANALMDGRDYVTPDDVKTMAYPTLRHRIILNYEGKAEGLPTEDIIDEVLDKVPVV